MLLLLLGDKERRFGLAFPHWCFHDDQRGRAQSGGDADALRLKWTRLRNAEELLKVEWFRQFQPGPPTQSIERRHSFEARFGHQVVEARRCLNQFLPIRKMLF